MKKILAAIAIMGMLTACNTTPVNTSVISSTTPTNKNPSTETDHVSGIAEVSISLNAAGESSAGVKALESKSLSSGLKAKTVTLGDTQPFAPVSSMFQRQSVGFHDDDTGASNGGVPVRYVYATFKVIYPYNATGIPDNYPNNNFTFWAISKDGATKNGTMFSSVRNGAGVEITDANIIRGIKPTHGTSVGFAGNTNINYSLADLYILPAAEASEVTSQIPSVYGFTGFTSLQFGYVTKHSYLTNDRDGVFNSADNYVTFAFKAPLNPLARQDSPFTFNFVFAYGNQTNSTVTQSLEEQKSFTAAANFITPAYLYPRLLGGSSRNFARDPKVENICSFVYANPSSTPVVLPAASLGGSSGAVNQSDTCYYSGGLKRKKFDNGFYAAYAATVTSAATDSSGKFVVLAKQLIPFLERYNNDGSLDTSFCGSPCLIPGQVNIQNTGSPNMYASGVANINFNKVISDGNGGYLIVGTGTSGTNIQTDLYVAHFLSNGNLDGAFNATAGPGYSSTPGFRRIDYYGKSNTGVSIARNPANGNIFVAGTATDAGSNQQNFAVAKLTSNGQLDPNFYNSMLSGQPAGTSDFLTLSLEDELTDIAFVNSNKLILTGTSVFSIGFLNFKKDVLLIQVDPATGTAYGLDSSLGYQVFDFNQRKNNSTTNSAIDDTKILIRNELVNGSSATTGKYYLSIRSGNEAVTMRFTASNLGVVDTTYGTNGYTQIMAGNSPYISDFKYLSGLQRLVFAGNDSAGDYSVETGVNGGFIGGGSRVKNSNPNDYGFSTSGITENVSVVCPGGGCYFVGNYATDGDTYIAKKHL